MNNLNIERIGSSIMTAVVCIAILFFVVVFSILQKEKVYNAYNHQQQILEQCEKDLPRNQSCVIIAVPKTN